MDSLNTAKITVERFTQAVGRPPQDDDMDRCNCDFVGVTGHGSCGWDEEQNLPRFMVGGDRDLLKFVPAAPGDAPDAIRTQHGIYISRVKYEALQSALTAGTERVQELTNALGVALAIIGHPDDAITAELRAILAKGETK